MAPEASVYRAAMLAGLACTAPVVVWAIGMVLTSGGALGAELGGAAAGLWLVQALCLAVLLPGCVTLWRARDATGGVLSFVLFPLPVLVLAWLIGALPAAALWQGPVLLLMGAGVVTAASAAVHALVRGPMGAAAVLALQTALGITTLMLQEYWLAWSGL